MQKCDEMHAELNHITLIKVQQEMKDLKVGVSD